MVKKNNGRYDVPLLSGPGIFGISCIDLSMKNPTTPKVITGESQKGIFTPKLSRIIIIPKKQMEYIAPFFK
jgi:hypothetical protein